MFLQQYVFKELILQNSKFCYHLITVIVNFTATTKSLNYIRWIKNGLKSSLFSFIESVHET